MAYRCSDTNKFASFEFEAEEDNSDVTDRTISVTVRGYFTCNDCSEELAENTYEFETEIDHECEKPEDADEDWEAPEPNFDFDDFNVDTGEHYAPTHKVDKKGVSKPVPFRYQKHYYDVTVSGTVVCNSCDEKIPFELEDSAAGSWFESLV